MTGKVTSNITSIEIQKNNKKRVNVYIDYEYSFSCDAELVYQHNLKSGSLIDSKEIGKIAEADNYLKAKRDALYIVEKTYKTEKEITDKLLKKGYSNETISTVLEFLKEYDFVDDTRYVKAYISDKSISQGKNKIKYDLKRKGIKDELLEVESWEASGVSESDAAFKLAEKKYNIIAKRETDKRKLYEKLGQYLVSRGYTWDVVKSVLNSLLKDYTEF